ASEFPNWKSFGKNSLSSGSGKLRLVAFLVIGIIVLIMLFNTFMIVPAGHRAVVFNNLPSGLSAPGEGLTTLFPFTPSSPNLRCAHTDLYDEQNDQRRSAQRG